MGSGRRVARRRGGGEWLGEAGPPRCREARWVPHRQTLAQEPLPQCPAQSRCSVNSCCRRPPRPALPWTGRGDESCWQASRPAHARGGGGRVGHLQENGWWSGCGRVRECDCCGPWTGLEPSLFPGLRDSWLARGCPWRGCPRSVWLSSFRAGGAASSAPRGGVRPDCTWPSAWPGGDGGGGKGGGSRMCRGGFEVPLSGHRPPSPRPAPPWSRLLPRRPLRPLL